jgi:SAM-dependent methyltransferase
MQNDSMKQYYARRAGEYESIYAKPERQADLRMLEQLIAKIFANRSVLEIACGTGYWTQFVATTARSITATDINHEVIEIAKAKSYRTQPQFLIADAYRPDMIPGKFDAVLSAFWWSHVPKERLGEFLSALHRSVPAGSLVAFLDNRYVEGSSTPISETDDRGNAYQDRKLADGSTHRVLKNFPTEPELREVLAPFSSALQVRNFDYYWLATFQTR